MSRVLDFNDSQSSATIPIIEGTIAFKRYVDEAAFVAENGAPQGGSCFWDTTLNVLKTYSDSDMAWNIMAENIKVTGSRAAPIAITAVGGITPVGKRREVIYCEGDGGVVDISANPQIAVGASIGDELILVGSGNQIKLDNGDGLQLNGACYLVDGAVLMLRWDGSVWLESYRNNL